MTDPLIKARRAEDHGWLRQTIIGGTLLLAGLALLFVEVQHPPSHTVHIEIFAGMAVLGALAISPKPLLRPVKSLVVILLPILPWAKGKQSSDDTLSGGSV